jgi:membrane protein implicated in regulation of membrane protease activity
MREEESEKIYPVKTLHEFLSELNKEWRRFKSGTLISLLILSALLAAFVPLFFRAIRLDLDIFVFIFPIVLSVFLIYSIRIMIVQYRFFRKWGHRMEQLVSLEENLMNEKLEEKAAA